MVESLLQVSSSLPSIYSLFTLLVYLGIYYLPRKHCFLFENQNLCKNPTIQLSNTLHSVFMDQSKNRLKIFVMKIKSIQVLNKMCQLQNA